MVGDFLTEERKHNANNLCNVASFELNNYITRITILLTILLELLKPACRLDKGEPQKLYFCAQLALWSYREGTWGLQM